MQPGTKPCSLRVARRTWRYWPGGALKRILRIDPRMGMGSCEVYAAFPCQVKRAAGLGESQSPPSAKPRRRGTAAVPCRSTAPTTIQLPLVHWRAVRRCTRFMSSCCRLWLDQTGWCLKIVSIIRVVVVVAASTCCGRGPKLRTTEDRTCKLQTSLS